MGKFKRVGDTWFNIDYVKSIKIYHDKEYITAKDGTRHNVHRAWEVIINDAFAAEFEVKEQAENFINIFIDD